MTAIKIIVLPNHRTLVFQRGGCYGETVYKYLFPNRRYFERWHDEDGNSLADRKPDKVRCFWIKQEVKALRASLKVYRDSKGFRDKRDISECLQVPVGILRCE